MLLIEIILTGFAAAAWVNGYRAKDREKLREIFCVSDDDLDTICKLLQEYEQDESEVIDDVEAKP